MIEILVAVCLISGLLLGLEVAYRLGRHAKQRGNEDKAQLGAIQGAVLGLLGLLLGFSFAVAASRFGERQNVIVHEANAIGTTYLRASLFPEPWRSRLRDLLRQYTNLRVAMYNSSTFPEARAVAIESAALHTPIWEATGEAIRSSPHLSIALLGPVNEVIDIHTLRVAYAQRHLPVLLLAVLVGCSLVAVGAVGYACGLSGRRNTIFTSALSFLVAAVLWLIIDLDNPRRGLIQAGQEAMLELQASLEADAARAPSPSDPIPR